jgi:uncharacterized protein
MMKTALRGCLTALLLSTGVIFAIDVTALKPQGYVSDFAGVVDRNSRIALERYAARVEKSTGVQMAFVTISSLEGQPVEDFANDLFRHWGIGQRGKDEGLLLLLVVGERRSRLEVGRGLEPYITDGTAGSLLRDMRAPLQQNQYGVALQTAAQRLGSLISQRKGVAIDEQLPRARPPEDSVSIPFPLLLGGAFLLFWIMSLGRGRRGRYYGGGGFLPGLIFGTIMGRSAHGGLGHGGFGGYDSGDTFGGFGGGDSGGGGASSNW